MYSAFPFSKGSLVEAYVSMLKILAGQNTLAYSVSASVAIEFKIVAILSLQRRRLHF
jgi:hypothetical protein